MQEFAHCLVKLNGEVDKEIDSQSFSIACWLVPSIKRLNSTLLLALVVEWRKLSLAVPSNNTPPAILSDIQFWLRDTQLLNFVEIWDFNVLKQ
ncbi:hypothetical protein Ciccas_002789 [Cichlidogyrus casuarinus]|uniref:Uncharacterized protein n=1 Tax=Cichlidogyrus casuarinus TaxID=1844966 RepID=A0ABD2QGM9_9PLAT